MQQVTDCTAVQVRPSISSACQAAESSVQLIVDVPRLYKMYSREEVTCLLLAAWSWLRRRATSGEMTMLLGREPASLTDVPGKLRRVSKAVVGTGPSDVLVATATVQEAMRSPSVETVLLAADPELAVVAEALPRERLTVLTVRMSSPAVFESLGVRVTALTPFFVASEVN